MGAATAAAHMALFTAHLEVFGLISAVVMVMVLRGGGLGSSCEHENVLRPRKAKGPASASPPSPPPDPRSASPKVGDDPRHGCGAAACSKESELMMKLKQREVISHRRKRTLVKRCTETETVWKSLHPI